MDLKIFKTKRKWLTAQGLVEFALVLPLLLLLVFGIIEAGRLLFLYSAVQSASREAVRYGSASGEVSGLLPYYGDCAGIQDAAMRIGRFAGVSASDVSISYDHGPGSGMFATCPIPGDQTVSLGDRIVVQVVTTWQPLLPLVNFTSFPISSQSSRTIIKDVSIEGTPPPPFLPTIAFVLDDQTVNEGDGDIHVLMQLTASSPFTVSVPFSVSGTATNGEDFTVVASPVNLSPGDTIAEIIVSLNDDDIDEDAETVVLTMGIPANAIKGTPSVHTITVEDNDDPPTVSFVLPDQRQMEDFDGLAVLQLSNPSIRDITVNFDVGGTAQGGVDYSITSSPITIPAMDTTFPIVIDVIDDLIDEEDETVVITLLDAVNATIGTPDIHTLTIEDNDDPPEVFFTWADQSGDETVGTMTVEFQLSIESSKVITVPFKVEGSATRDVDYTLNSTPLVIPPGELTASTVITIIEDGDDTEEDETIVLTLLDPINAVPGSPSVHTVTITDTVTIPTVSFDSASQTSDEAVLGKLTVWVILSEASSNAVVVPYSVSGTATQDVDYSIDSSPATIPSGGAQASIDITLYDDAMDEDDETIVISMGTPNHATKGNPSVHTITIIDDDPEPQLIFTSSGQTVAEDVGSVTIVAQLSVISGKDITVPFSLSGTAELGVDKDYTITASPVTIPAGNISVDIVIDVVDDDERESDEDVVVTLDTPTNATLGSPAQFNLTIQDNEPDLNCPGSTGLPYFGSVSNKNKLFWDFQSQDPLVPVNLTAVTIQWPTGTNSNVTAITFGETIYSGNASPPFLAVNTPYPLWNGAFDTRQMAFIFNNNPQLVVGDFYQLSATFEGCPPVTDSIPSG